jgi:homoserine dehydrogenase
LTAPAPPPVVTVPVAVLGTGGVGTALLERLMSARDALRGRGLELAVVAVADSTAWLAGVPQDPELAAVVAHKRAGGTLRDWAGPALTATSPGALAATAPGVLADASAADTATTLQRFARAGWSLALANKRPLVGSLASFRALTADLDRTRWETTVAGCLPVIAPLQALAAANDPVARIRGAVSSTLGHVVAEVASGQPFSAAVGQAVALGVAEPDPRADLLGTDAGRKGLILARTLGWPLEPADVRVRGLLPAEWAALPAAELTRRLPELDDRVAGELAAVGAGRRPGYVVTVAPAGVSGGLVGLPDGDPLAALPADVSWVEITSAVYTSPPLVISGRGGGPVPTAAGLFSDVVGLAAALRWRGLA